MINLTRGAALAAILTSLSFAPAALAQGGGSVNSGGVNGGGASTGGGGGGKVCGISSLDNRAGYYSSFAAIWASYSIVGCPGASYTMEFRNDLTGAVDYSSQGVVPSKGGGSMTGVVDADFLTAYSTPYTVTLRVSTESRSAPATTPDPK